MHEIEKKHQFLYAVYMLFIRWNELRCWNVVMRKPQVLYLLRNSYFIIGTLLLESRRPSSKGPSR